MKTKLLIVFALAAAAGFATPIQVTWDFSAGTCVVELPCSPDAATSGPTQAFKPSSGLGSAIIILSTGGDAAGLDLDLKHDGGDENGVGIFSLDHDEIQVGDTIFVNLDAPIAAGYTGFQVKLGSIQSGEKGRIYDQSGSFDLGSNWDQQFHTVTPTWFGNNQGFKVGASSSDVLLMSVTADPDPARVPEPSSIVLLGSSLLVSMTVLRRRARKQQ
jgi:hypothetical protein